MKKVLFVSLLIVMCFFVLPAQGKYGGGTGEPNNPYLIFDANQLNTIGANPGDWDKHFRLMADIDLSGFNGLNGNPSFNIIGATGTGFTGVFDGNGHEISNFRYHLAGTNKIGLFSHIEGTNTVIRDLLLRNPDVDSGSWNLVGALVGMMDDGSVLSKCRIEGGSVSGRQGVGGLVGFVNAGNVLIDYCHSTCSVLATVYGVADVGGLIGINEGIVSNCYSTGSISCPGEVVWLGAGGLVGRNSGTVSNCYSTSNINSTAETSEGYVGGLVGYNSQGVYDNKKTGIIENSYSLGSVSGNRIAGGLSGMNHGRIYNSYSLSSVSGNSRVGGLVGMNVNPYIGGIQYDNGKISNCYSAGSVTGDSSVGGLVGEFTSGTISASFWDVNTSGQASSDGGTGKTTAEMQTESTFTDAGWDFVTRIWKMCKGPCYPSLWWEICTERPILYVDADATGGNNGSSWANAFNRLHYALAAARYGDEIHVAQGTYKPPPLSPPPPPPPPPPPTGESYETGTTVEDSNRTATFKLINGVYIMGGYAGIGEPDPNARDIATYETILSGDLAGNDKEVKDPRNLYNDPCRADNSYHVVTGSGCDESAMLDGFTITGGNANRFSDEIDSGGGIYNKHGSPTLINCTFASNSAGNDGLGGGGGMYNYDSSPSVINCVFSKNAAVYDCGGGGIYNDYSNPTFSNCTFSGNTAEYCGGGMYNILSNPEVTNCTFAYNFAPFRGGGIHNDYGSFNPRLTNCTFISNHSDVDGGAIYNFLHCSPTITKCTFSDNYAGENGGGTANCFGNNPTLTNCLFSGNRAGQDGGGIYNYGYQPAGVTSLTNSAFMGNFAVNGSALACDSFHQEYPGSHEITNCIFYDGDTIWNNDSSAINISYTNLWGGQAACHDPCEAIVWGVGNIDADPCLALPGYWGDSNDPNIIVEPNDPNAIWVDGDYHLKSQAGRWEPNSKTWIKDSNTSPCIDAGDPNMDWIAELWPHGERINMGFYGGTAEASMSLSDAGNIADLNIDGKLCNRDIKLFTDSWLYKSILLPEDVSRDGIVNFIDFSILSHLWELPARYPNPVDSATSVNIVADLSWTTGRGATSHDVYFGTGSQPTFIGNQTSTTFEPGTMAYSTKYYWRIDEVNKWGTTTGSIWSFTTIAAPPPVPPGQASNPNPADGATSVSLNADLNWTAGSNATSHDVYFGTSSMPPFIGNQISTTFDPGTMTYSTEYYWRIDEVNSSIKTSGVIWNFTTRTNPPPPPPP